MWITGQVVDDRGRALPDVTIEATGSARAAEAWRRHQRARALRAAGFTTGESTRSRSRARDFPRSSGKPTPSRPTSRRSTRDCKSDGPAEAATRSAFQAARFLSIIATSTEDIYHAITSTPR